MEPLFALETKITRSNEQELLVHEWRAERLRWLGVPPAYAEVFADLVDWHMVAELVARGCPPGLALEIVR
jgi:hypothetical protein